jgi:GlpG protein
MIGTLLNENQAQRFSIYLKRKGIENHCEGFFDAQTGHMEYKLWVQDEDQLVEAAKAFEQFQKSPSAAEFDIPLVEQLQIQEEQIAEEGEEPPLIEPSSSRPFVAHFTLFMICLCSFVFFLNTMEEVSLRQKELPQRELTSIQEALLYDLPVKAEAPQWRGLYDWAFLKLKKENPSMAVGPLFEKIRQGEIWRLFSPAILHSDFLHILFNMFWLWILGRPIEKRIGVPKTLLLTLAVGVFSNTAQYLMSGPLFLGYSGVAMGLAGFIWMREKIAPWEGYPLNRTTVLFLVFFIGAMAALQFASFFIQLFSHYNFEPNIANTAHIAGALMGAALARGSFFAQRVRI